MALLASSLAPYAAQPVNVDHVVAMLLVHDIGEIDTGDTIFYAEQGLAERKAAERVAVERIFGLLPAEAGARCLALWAEFEADATPEARFAHAADRAMPVLLNLANDGQSWRENGITCETVLSRVGPPIQAGCPAMWAYLEQRIRAAQAAGWFGTAGGSTSPAA